MEQSTIDPKKIVAGAIILVWEERNRVLKAIAIPLVLYLVIGLLPYFDLPFGVLFVIPLFLVVIQAIVAITVHRIVLLDEASVPIWGIRAWTMRETVFLLHVVLVALCTIPVSLLALIPAIGGLVATVGSCRGFLLCSQPLPLVS
jgi:hypothetical protein